MRDRKPNTPELFLVIRHSSQADRAVQFKINSELDTYFVGVALAMGVNPTPKYGAERVLLAGDVAHFMAHYKAEPALMQKVRANFRELGGRLLDADPTWFYTKLADAFLDWLYAQNLQSGP